MANVMLMLGTYLFHVDTAAYQELQRSTRYDWSGQDHLYKGMNPGEKRTALRYKGLGEETLHLNGTLYPHYKGGLLQLHLMRLSASLGMPLPLLSAGGFILGQWVIEHIEETQSDFFDNGAPRKINFRLSLKRFHEVDDTNTQ